MSIFNDLNEIIDNAHMWNWAPDWGLVQDVYKQFPNSYSILTPFAYTYLEEMIRTTTSEYGIPPFDRDGKPNKINVGMGLIALAIKENSGDKEYVKLLNDTKKYFKYIDNTNDENGRNRVLHGHIHPRFWGKEDFEKLISHLAKLSQFARF